MKQLLVDDIIQKRIRQAQFDQLIYKIHFESTVFYIGQSKRDIVTRLWEHLNQPSRLGKLIRLNEPGSRRWRLTFYTLADCRPFVGQKRLFTDQAWEHFDMDMAEKALIAHFRPVVNADFNATPTLLPAQFKGQHLFSKKTAASTLGMTGDAAFAQWANKMRLNGWVSVDGSDGRTFWKHKNGRILNERQVQPYWIHNKLPKPE